MRLEINGFSMAFETAGTGQPLLLVHGYPLSRKMWGYQRFSLARQAQVIAPDLRGHGESEPVTGPYTMELLADDLAALLDTLQVQQPVTLCGLSMGGYVALAFARRHPQRLGRLVLAATRAAPDSPQARQNRDLAMQTAREQGVATIAASMAPRLLAPENAQSYPDLLAQVQGILAETSLEGVLGALEGMKQRLDSTPFLDAIRVPVLVVHGEQDMIVPVDEARQVAAAIPGAQLEVIAQAGHLPNLEQPLQFNTLLRNFIGRSKT